MNPNTTTVRTMQWVHYQQQIDILQECLEHVPLHSAEDAAIKTELWQYRVALGYLWASITEEEHQLALALCDEAKASTPDTDIIYLDQTYAMAG